MTSVGQILLRTADPGAACAGVDAALGRFGFRRTGPASTVVPVAGARGAEVREFVVGRVGDFVVFVAEDLESLFETAYAMHRSAGVPVVAAARFGPEWRCKAYVDRDLALKVGADPDRELDWVGFPLDAERAPAVSRALGRGFEGFVGDVVRGAATPRGLDEAVGQPVTSLGFRALSSPLVGGWSYLVWAQAPWG